jgi:transcription elongation factor S-II
MNRALSFGNPSKFREHFIQQIKTKYDLGDHSINVEKSIYNFTIRECQFRQLVKKWTNPQFCEIYLCRMRSLLTNFQKNPDFLEQVKTKQITPEMLSVMTHQEISPEHWRERIDRKIKIDQSHFQTNIEASTDMFTCKKCKSKRCTFYEMQTRSADEPATIFITCLDCGKSWRN